MPAGWQLHFTTAAMATPAAAQQQRTSQHVLDEEAGKASFSIDTMHQFLEGDAIPIKQRVWDTMATRPDLWTHDFRLSLGDGRRRGHEQVKFLLQHKLFTHETMRSNWLHHHYATEAVAHGEPCIAIKQGLAMNFTIDGIHSLGSPEQAAQLVQPPPRGVVDLQDMRATGCFAMTEMSHGSNVFDLRTTAVYDVDSEEFIVNTPDLEAYKWWIGQSLHATYALVFAQLIVGDNNYGVHCFVVPIRDPDSRALLPGVTVGDVGPKVGNHYLDNGFLAFDHVRIPRRYLLDRFGTVAADGAYASRFATPARRFGRVLSELTMGRTTLVGASAYFLLAGVNIAVRFSVQRRQFRPGRSKPEQPVLEYQSQQRKLIPLLAQGYALFAARTRIYQLYVARDTDAVDKHLHTLSAGLKAIASWTAQHGLGVARRACGGFGYMATAMLGSARDDQDVFCTFEGDNSVLMQQVAKDLLMQYRRRYGKSLFAGAWKFMSVVAGDLVSAYTPDQNASLVRDSSWQLAALTWRVNRMVHSCANKLRLLAKKRGFAAAWNMCLQQLIDMAKAHTQREILAIFQAWVETCPDERCAAALTKLCDLYALDIINDNLAYFLAYRYIGRATAKAVSRSVNQLCLEIRPDAVALCDAFAIPQWLQDRNPLTTKNGLTLYQNIKASSDAYNEWPRASL